MRNEVKWKLKYILDFVMALCMLIALSPVFIMTALAIWINDRGTIFFKQPRLGMNGKSFVMYKFRSMKMDAPDLRFEDGSTFNSADDPRVTSVGKVLRKTSLDELPQIINILKGDMSFIGPRPDLPDQIKLYEPADKKRLLVRPGITGYAQVIGRNQLGFRERFKYDIEYIDHYNMLFDLKILVRTAMIVSKRENVNRN